MNILSILEKKRNLINKMNINEYFKHIENKVKICYDVAGEARIRGLDPLSVVEIPIATSLAERVAGLISAVYPQLGENKKFIKRLMELEKEHGSLDPAICLIIAEETAKSKFCEFSSFEEAFDAGIRVAIAYTTLGVVASPIEGYTHFNFKKTMDGKDYISAYFSGPIRSAGGTAAAFSLLIIDHLREVFEYDKYDPQDDEIKRSCTEVNDYHERITNLQYLPSEEEVQLISRNLPIQVNGEPSEKLEASNYKDLDRVETNFLRSGFSLVIAEGLAQKSSKILMILKKLREKGFKLSDWDWLEDLVSLQKTKAKEGAKIEATYIKDLVAGRPVLGHPSKSGAFRLRYGRSRNSGYSTLCLHPASFAVLDGFIAVGTQLKIELPTKGTAVSSCDSIDGPIVRLKNGDLLKLDGFEKAKSLAGEIEEIIYLGDILVPYGDFANRNHVLMPAGYVPEWWDLDLEKKSGEKFDSHGISFENAIKFSEIYSVPLHPDFIFYWSQIGYVKFMQFLDWLSYSRVNGKIIFPFSRLDRDKFNGPKKTLEILAVPHKVTTENVVVEEKDSKALFSNLGLDLKLLGKDNYELGKDVSDLIKKIKASGSVLSIVNELSPYELKDKAGTFIGARMGRPEKAKLRKLIGSPNVLFPVGQEGGRLRSVQEAIEQGNIKSDFPVYYCKNCEKETIYFICEVCGKNSEKRNFCYECQQTFLSKKCPEHSKGQSFSNRRIDIRHYFESAIKNLELHRGDIPPLIKGVRGTSSEKHSMENLAKGFLRSIFNLQVNKDGTIRFDVTELPLSHFKAKEIGVEIEDLKELGYLRDIHGKSLVDEDQILEIKPHDIILPSCPESPDEKADDVFVRIANFVDSLLVRFYKRKAFYNVKDRDDLIGHLVSCIAPHNSAAVVGRIIGFSKTQALLASPYIHAAMRRDCDGDEAAVMLLLDMLINFSREFLPSHRGGTQDAPLVLNARIRAGEVDDMVFDFDVFKKNPLELYAAAENMQPPSYVKLEQVKDRLGEQEFSNLNYTHETDDLNDAVLCSRYKTIPTMKEKVEGQMYLVEKIRAVDTSDVARLIIERHFIRDIRGNLRKFSMQQFRCTKCNEKYRRPPLSGVCMKCNGKIIFTISEGSIVKYLEPALDLARKYQVPPYVQQSIELTKDYIESIFGREKEKQEELKRWF